MSMPRWAPATPTRSAASAAYTRPIGRAHAYVANTSSDLASIAIVVIAEMGSATRSPASEMGIMVDT